EDGIRDDLVTGVQTCALPISLLVRVRLLRVLLHPDHPAPDRRRLVAQRALEGEVALAVGRDVLLERVVVEVLRAVGEIRARDAQIGRASCRERVWIASGSGWW